MRIISLIIIIIFANTSYLYSNDDFNIWLNSFAIKSKSEGISDNTINNVLKKARFLPDVIKYDRYQPEFYEDTQTYISKRVSKTKVIKGAKLYKQNYKVINKIEEKFFVEKELLLSLMAIETNYGNYLGKMNIISSLATLSYDKRRSEFFSKELLTALKLIDKKLIDHKILYGSWAGAFGNFQFMPSTIKNYAIDFDKNNVIDLKSINDSFASAANYVNKIGWKKNAPCFKKIILKNDIPIKYLNTSAKEIKYKRKFKFYKKYIKNYEDLNISDSLNSAIITPDKEIVNNSDIFTPAFIVFDNYDLILKWNRSLRFALAVCTLKENFNDEL